MITTQEDAFKHANHTSLKKHSYVVVFPDGSINASSNKEQMQSLLTEDSFVVKGDLEKPKKKVKETKEITE